MIELIKPFIFRTTAFIKAITVDSLLSVRISPLDATSQDPIEFALHRKFGPFVKKIQGGQFKIGSKIFQVDTIKSLFSGRITFEDLCDINPKDAFNDEFRVELIKK